MAKYFYVYRFCEGKQELVEIRENVKFKGDESKKHGDPQKARATSSVLRDTHVLANKKFGPNLPRLLKDSVLAKGGELESQLEAGGVEG